MTPAWFEQPLDEGDTGDAVLIVQRKLGAIMSGVMDLSTMARVRGYQREHGLPQTGVVDQATAELLGDKPSAGLVPEWYHRELGLGDTGPDVEALRQALGQPPGHTYDNRLEAAVRRFQASIGLAPSGRIQPSTATSLAARTV